MPVRKSDFIPANPPKETIAWKRIGFPLPIHPNREMGEGYERITSSKDGMLRCLVAIEDGRWHLSLSFRGAYIVETGQPFRRLPTWYEITDARYRFIPNEINMAMFLPPIEEYVNAHPTTMHLWEIK